MRHVIHDLRPILARIFPDRRQGVTFDAAMHEEISPSLEPSCFRFARRCHNRRIVRGFAADEEADKKRDRNPQPHVSKTDPENRS